MGLFGRIREKQAARVNEARDKAVAEARTAGASEADAREAGEKAAHKQRRRNFLRSGAATGGFSG